MTNARSWTLVSTLVVLLTLSGCAGTVGQVAGGATAGNAKVEALVDRGIARAGVAADEYLDALDATEALLQRKLERTRSGRCLSTLPSLERFAREGPAQRAILKRDCNVVFPDIDAIVVRSKEDEEPE